MRIIRLLLLLFLPVFAKSQTPLIIETSTHLEIQAEKYSVKISKNPVGMTVLRGQQLIAALSDSSALSFQENGKTIWLTKIEKWKMQGKTLFLTAGNTGSDQKSDLTFSFESDRIYFSWHQPEFQNIDNMTTSFTTRAGKHWFGGSVVAGHQWPLETAQVRFDPMIATSNQATPFWLTASGVGYYMPTYEPMGFSLNHQSNGRFELFMKRSNIIEIQLLIGDDVRDAYRIFAKNAGLPKTVPPKAFFSKPIFNTWIEYLKDINQAKVLEYANNIRSKNFPCEVLMIDAGWSPIHGDYEFDKVKFPDPKAMIDALHRLNFKLILWTSPYVRVGSPEFAFLEKNGYFIKDETGTKPGTIKWWGGTDYEIDMSNPQAFQWFLGKLRSLQARFGVDGYKQDGGDTDYIPLKYKTFAGASPNRSTDWWAHLGDYFEYNEYRVSWMMQSSGLVQRLRDKHNNWSSANGLGSLIPHGLTSSLIGYSYFCPDMIGGGDSKDFRDPNYKGMGTELFIRWAQASALMPMMQFSYAPWNLDADALKICQKYAQLHEELGEYIYELALKNQKTGDPIVRPLFYDNSEDEQAYLVSDQFMLGDRFLVAPVLEKGAVKRNIYLPKGLWKDYWTNTIYTGGVSIIDYPAPIDVLPIIIKLD